MVKKSTFFVMLAVMSLFFLMTAYSAIAPALQSIFAYFGPQGYSLTTLLLISTLPSLTCIPASLFAGVVAGSKIKYKTLAIIGTFLFLVAGIAPVFTNNFVIILIARAVFGIGIGTIAPLGSALVLGLFEGEKRMKLLGLGTIVMNLGGIVLQFLGGFLASFGWSYSFYVHGFSIISLVLVIFFLPEPEKLKDNNESKPVKQKIKLPVGVWVASILFGFMFMMIYPVIVNISTLLAQANLGDSTVSAILLSLFTVGGMMGGACFSKNYMITKRFIFGISLLLQTAGLALIVYGNNIIMLSIGMILAGFSLFTIMPAIYMIFGMIATPGAFAISSSILLSSMNAFSFLATYWIGFVASITGDSIVKPIFFGMIIIAALSIIFLFVNPIPKTKSSITE